MNEYDKIRILEMGISYLQKVRSGITDNLVPARGPKHDELINSRNIVDEKINAMINKRNELIVETACNIAEVEPIEI